MHAIVHVAHLKGRPFPRKRTDELGVVRSEKENLINILLSAYACEPHGGSEARGGWNWAVNLTKLGHEVHVLTGHHLEDEQSRRNRTELAAEIPRLHLVVLDIPKTLMPLTRRGSLGVYLRYLMWLKATLRAGRSLSRDTDFDLVHHVTWGSLMWGSPLWRLGVPFVFGPVGGGHKAPKSLRAYFDQEWWKEALRSFFIDNLLPLNPSVRATLRHAALVLATNSDTLELVQRMGAPKAKLALDSATPPDFLSEHRVPEVVDEPLRIAWVGRLRPIKGLTLALEALRRVPSDVDWHLTIAGDGRQGRSLPAWLDDPQLRKRVDWLGQVGWSQMKSLYEHSNLMLFTSLRDSFGAQLCEALACGLPVVALDHHGVHDFVPEDAAVKVQVGGPEDTADRVAHAIEWLARNPAKRADMSEAALRFAAQTTWEAKARGVYSEIAAILESSDGEGDSSDTREE